MSLNDESSSSSTSKCITLKDPAQGSANPSASLASLWNYLEPALRHILCSPSSTSRKAPAVDFAYYVGIHTAVFNYVSSSKLNGKREDRLLLGMDFYEQLDKYFAEVAHENYLGAPSEDSALTAYYVRCFNRYTTGAQSISRLLNYINRHTVKRSFDEGRGWLRLTDVPDTAVEPTTVKETPNTELRKKRRYELRRWGYKEGGTMETLAAAEACAEAASPLERIVPISSLGHRRWRTEVVEPLLCVPNSEEGESLAHTSDADDVPKGRLARAVKELIEGPDAQSPSSVELAESLSKSLRICGIRIEHPLLKKLDNFVSLRHGG